MAWASDYIGGFLNRLTIADQSRIFRSNMETMSAKSPTPQLPALAIWWSGPSPLHSLLSSGYGDRVQAQSTSTGACDLQFASRHGSIRSWQRGRQAGEGEEGEGPAPLLKSRDPLLAGGEKNLQSPAHKTAARTHTKSNYITYMIFSHIHSR